MMTDKQKQLLQYLHNQEDWVNGQALASTLQVSLRSIKNYISQINSEVPNTIASSRKGYAINSSRTDYLKSLKSKQEISSIGDRILFTINYLVKKNEPINIFDLCDILFVSETTLKSDFKEIRKKIQPFDLTLHLEKNNVTIVGIEKNKRKLLSSLLYEESNSSFLDFQTIEQAFPNIDITSVNNIIISTFHKYNWFINDYSKMNLLLHVVIAIDRLRSNVNYESSEDIEEVKTDELRIANEISEQLQEELRITFNQHERNELSLLIASYTTNINFQDATLDNIQKIIGDDCYTLVKDVIQAVGDYYYIDLSEPQFFIRFALHVFNLQKRTSLNIHIRNPLADNIKQRCPLIYECAVGVSNQIQERIGYTISDDEIGYIAFHLGSTLESQKRMEDTISVVLLFPQYYDLDKNITKSLARLFDDELFVKNVIEHEEKIEEQECDLILSMIPVNQLYSKKILQISPFLSKKDVHLIQSSITKIKEEKRKTIFREQINYLFKESLFFTNTTFQSKEDTISFMANKLKEEGCVDDDFESEVFRRESLSSTGFARIAIPHAMKMRAKHSGMCIIVNDDKHLQSWDVSKVNIVLMLAISTDERKMFLDIFDTLTSLLIEDENIFRLINIHTFNEFKEALVNLIE